MKRATCLLAIVAAAAMAVPAMAQNSNSGIVVGNSQNGQAQVPQPADGNVNWKGVGIGAGTVAGNVLYVPAKVVYGILGGLTGGASYLLTGGNTQTANTIWRSSLGGDYVLTPEMIAGQKPVHFSGPTTMTPPTEPAAPATASPTINSSPINSAAPARTASADPGKSSVDSSPVPGDTAKAGSAIPQPADRGTGPVGSGSSAAHAPSGGTAVSPLPGTSIE